MAFTLKTAQEMLKKKASEDAKKAQAANTAEDATTVQEESDPFSRIPPATRRPGPPLGERNMPCWDCKGLGKDHLGEECNMCNGTGAIPYDKTGASVTRR
jgi:hypothetical protein